jgi:hypothetical protein
LIPDEHAERELDSDPRIRLHQPRAGAWVAEHDDHLVGQVHTRFTCRRSMIDLSEHHQAFLRDGIKQTGHRLAVSGRADGREHRTGPY